MEEIENWLHSAVIQCPKCALDLWRVDHSPFFDCYRLYCQECPKSVEVSFQGGPGRGLSESEVARLLRPCDCGVRFDPCAARRCARCNTPVLMGEDALGVDLDPSFGCTLETLETLDLAPEQELAMETHQAEFVRTSNLWLEPPQVD